MAREHNLFDGGGVYPASTFLPPPLQDDLRRAGIWAGENDEAAQAGKQSRGQEVAQVSGRIQASLLRVMDHFIARKIIPGITTRGDYVRASIFFFTRTLADMISARSLSTAFARLQLEQQLYAARLDQINADKAADVCYKSAHLALQMNDRAGAIETLRSALAFMAMLSSLEVQEKFSAKMYGDPTGTARPAEWENDEVAVLWDEVVKEAEVQEEEDVRP